MYQDFTLVKTVGHFQDVPSLCFKARLSAKPLLYKIMQIKHIFIRSFALSLVRILGTRNWLDFKYIISA